MSKIEKFKRELVCVFDDNLHTKIWHNVADWVIIFLIIVSSLEVFLSTFESINESYGSLLHSIDIFTTIVFTVEVSLRIWVADLISPKYKGFWGRMKYCFSFYGLLDLLSTYPFYLQFFMSLPVAAMKILRVARLLRIFRYMAAFRILGDAISSKRQELSISMAFLGILTVILSFLLYYAEHDAQPDLCENGWMTMVWAFAKYLGDPGKIADFPLVTFWGHFIAAIVGILGIAIFAVPAGLISSGFVEVIENRNAQKKIEEDGQAIAEMMLVKSIVRHKVYFPATNISFGELKLQLGLSDDEILKAATASKNLRVKNLANAISSGPKIDMLVVNCFHVNTDYGSHIDRQSGVTVVNPLGTGDNGLSFFTWHIAELGGFNYVANELFSRTTGARDRRYNFYSFESDVENVPAFRRYVDDILSGAGPDDWIIVIAGEQTVKDAETDFHFNTGAPKGSDTFECEGHLVNDLDKLKVLYDDFSETLLKETGLKTDAHKVQPTLKKNNISFHLQSKTKANVLLINVSYRLMVFDKELHNAMWSVSTVLSRNLETRKQPGIHTENYRTRSIDSPYWRGLYSIKD